MNHILQHLKTKGVPDNSFLTALNYYAWGTGDTLDGADFLPDLRVIIDSVPLPPFGHEKEIELTYKYLLEHAFKNPKMDLIYGLQDLVTDCFHKAKVFIDGMPFLKAEKEQPFGAIKAPVATKTISVENQDGTKTELKVKQKKGGKKEAALELFKKLYNPEQHEATRATIIEKFMKDLDMGKPGATTYFHNFKSGTWK